MPEKSESLEAAEIARIKETIKSGALFRARDMLMNALKTATQPEGFYPLLGEVASKFKQAGLLETAAEVLEHQCELLGDPGDLTTWKLWIKELRQGGWQMARRDEQRSSRCTMPRGQPLRFRPLWSYEFPLGPIAYQEIWNLPAAIVAHDMLITFNASLQGFIGIELEGGSLKWESGMLANRIDYAMSPVYIRPHIYLALPGSIKRLSVYQTKGATEVLKTSRCFQLSPFGAPAAFGKTFVSVFRSHLFLYETEADRGELLKVPLKDHESLRMPIVCNENLYFLSNVGRLFQLIKNNDRLEINCINQLPFEGAVCSPPCVVVNAIYFEMVTQNGVRQVGCYKPEEEKLFLKVMDNEFCNHDHSHLNFPAVADGEGVLFCSDNHSRLYKVRQSGELLEIIPINVHSANVGGNLDLLPQFYALTLNSHFLAKCFGGFLYINLLNGLANTEVFVPHQWEIISQPIFYAGKVMFICKEGIKCYEAD